MAQQTSIRVSCFMAGEDTPRAILSQKCVLWETAGETPSAWGVSLNWLAAIKHT